MTSEHTPTPWHMRPIAEHEFGISCHATSDALKSSIGKAWSKDNAAFIVRAVNAHEDLVEALRKAQQRIEELAALTNALAGFRKVRADDYSEEVRAALAKAKGEK